MADGNMLRSRKWMLTFHNIQEQGWSHDKIKESLGSLKLEYWALVDEVGGETSRLHTHLIIYRSTAIRARTLTKLFGSTHQDILHGTMAEARSYLLKDGKWKDTEKAETTVSGTFEEWGELPEEKGRGHRSDLELMMEMVKDGYNDLEIINAIPNLVNQLTAIQKYRQLVIEERAHDFRKMSVYYCYGKTGAGKTKGVYEMYKEDLSSIYTINSYPGNFNGLFDSYDSSKTKVLVLDEYRSSLPFNLLLSLTDGQYQIINSRYSNRIATHTHVWIISNISLLEQYRNIQQEEPESWKALLRRINTVRHYYNVDKFRDYTVEEYLHAERYGLLTQWEKAPPAETPFLDMPVLPLKFDIHQQEKTSEDGETLPFE